jgi:hypothetical protein
MLSGPLPVSILRAAQFHELVGQLVDWGKQNEVSYVPKMRTQLVAARTVAGALADLATGAGMDHEGSFAAPIPEIAGPREESLVEMAILLVRRRGEPLRIDGMHTPTTWTASSTCPVRCYPALKPLSRAQRSSNGSTPRPERDERRQMNHQEPESEAELA